VGWLYGAVHYGTAERPSMSQAAARAIAQTRHVYLEQTDRSGTSWPMHNALEQDLEAITSAKGRAAKVSAERMRQGLIAAKQMEMESGGVALVLAGSDSAYHEHWVLAHNYCSSFYEYGTERLALAFATGKDIIIHSLETEATKQAALAGARDERCRQNRADTPPPPAVDPATVSIDAVCAMILHDISRDQGEGRPNFLTAAAMCVADSRNQTMAARISAAVKAGEKPFVIVGRGHLMPGQNLVALLEEHGLTVRRID
jgi:hypothetical protein